MTMLSYPFTIRSGDFYGSDNGHNRWEVAYVEDL